MLAPSHREGANLVDSHPWALCAVVFLAGLVRSMDTKQSYDVDH